MKAVRSGSLSFGFGKVSSSGLNRDPRELLVIHEDNSLAKNSKYATSKIGPKVLVSC